MRRNSFFDLIVKEHRNMVFTFCYALLRDTELAEEVTQDVFVAAYEKILAGAEVETLPAWLRGISRNKCAHTIRERARERRIMAMLATTMEQTFRTLDDPEAGDAWEDRIEVLGRCRLKLPAHQRRAVELHYDLGLGAAEVAQETGWVTRTVYQLLWSARRLLRECMNRHLSREARV